MIKSFISAVLMSMTVLLGAALFGCGDDDTSGPNITPPAYDFPENADILMANFRKAYQDMDLDGYRTVLHDQFNFIFQQGDIEHLGLPSDRLTREEELLIASNMFNGHGSSPISRINFEILDPEGSWQDIGAGHPDFPNSSRRVYHVELSFERPGDTTLEVEGLAEFFAVSRDSTLQGGAVKSYWELIGLIDRTVGAGVKVGLASWGGVKSLYR